MNKPAMVTARVGKLMLRAKRMMFDNPKSNYVHSDELDLKAKVPSR